MIKRYTEILIKYRHERDIDPEDKFIINRMCLTGLMKRGLSIKRQKITAKTVDFGMELIPWWYRYI